MNASEMTDPVLVAAENVSRPLFAFFIVDLRRRLRPVPTNAHVSYTNNIYITARITAARTGIRKSRDSAIPYNFALDANSPTF